MAGNPTVRVSPKLSEMQKSHDISLAHDGSIIGLKYVRGQPSILQHIPLTEPVKQFSETQQDWTGGRGRKFFREDPTAYWDSKSAWTMTGGECYQVPQWYYGTGIRVAATAFSGNVSWRGLFGGVENWIADSFSAPATDTFTHVQLKVRQVGYPASLTVALYTNAGGVPTTIIGASTYVALAPTVGDFEVQEREFSLTAGASLTSGTTYWIVAYGAATDNETDHWEIGVTTSNTGLKRSAAGVAGTWATASPAAGMFYRVTPADIAQKIVYFIYDHCLYCLTTKDSGGAPELYINGDRGICDTTDGSNSNTLIDTASGCRAAGAWTSNMWAGYYVRIIGGNGTGQVREIASNTTTTLTVTQNWRRKPAAASTRYVIYGGPRWFEITGHGFTGAPSCRPIQSGGVCYVAQGVGLDVQRMKEDTTEADNHAFQGITVTTDIRFDYLENHMMPNLGVRLFAAKAGSCWVGYTTAPAWATTNVPTFTPVKGSAVGSSEYRITSMKSVGEKLLFGKEDSLWFLDESTPKQYTLAIKDVPDWDNLSSIGAQGDTIYFGYGNSFGYLMGTEHKDLLNYRAGYEGLPADRSGSVTSVLAVLGWVFFAVDGGEDNYSSVYAWNGIGIHEIWRSWKTGCRIRDLFYYACYERKGQLWIDAGGEPVYVDMPLKRSNPRLDSTIYYRPEWSLTTGTMDIEKENLFKAFKRVRVMSENLSTNTRWIEVDYQADADVGTTKWKRLGKIVTSPYQELMLSLGNIQKMRFRFRGLTTEQSTPAVMTSFDVLGEVSEAPKYQWIGTFEVFDNGKTYNMQKDFDPTYIYKWLKEAHDKMYVCHMRACREIDDDKLVTLSLPADVIDVCEKGRWDGRISLALREI
jgi:hypothetical protein